MMFDVMGFMQQLQRASSVTPESSIVPNTIDMAMHPRYTKFVNFKHPCCLSVVPIISLINFLGHHQRSPSHPLSPGGIIITIIILLIIYLTSLPSSWSSSSCSLLLLLLLLILLLLFLFPSLSVARRAPSSRPSPTSLSCTSTRHGLASAD